MNMASRDIKASPRAPLPVMKTTREKAVVMYKYTAENPDELNLEVGDVILILDKELEDSGWWKGELNGKVGVFPDNFVELVPHEKSAGRAVIPGLQKSKSQDKTPETEISRPFENVNKSSKSVADQTAITKPLPGLPLKKPNFPADEGRMDYTKHGTLDSVSAEQRLNHITANRARAPQRRPPKQAAGFQQHRDNGQEVERDCSTDDEISTPPPARPPDPHTSSSPPVNSKNIPERIVPKTSHNNIDSSNLRGTGSSGFVDGKVVAQSPHVSEVSGDINQSGHLYSQLRSELIQFRSDLERIRAKHDREVSELMKEIESEKSAVKALSEELNKLKKLVRNKVDSG